MKTPKTKSHPTDALPPARRASRGASVATSTRGGPSRQGPRDVARNEDTAAKMEYQKLLAEREHTEAELKRLRSYLEDEVERVIDGSEDSVDAASDVYEREKTLAIIQTLEKKLASVEHALHAAEKGGYGICEICGNPIDPARLAAMPQSTTCISCQQKLERQQRRRPSTAFALREEE